MTFRKKEFGKRGTSSTSHSSRGAYRSHHPDTPDTASLLYSSDEMLVPEAENFAFSDNEPRSSNLFSMLFSFEGRINRSRYWLIEIPRFIFTAISIAAMLLERPDLITASPAEQLSFLFTTSTGMFYLALLAPLGLCFWSINARRLHDRGHSGWWQLLMLIPFIGVLYGGYMGLANAFFAGTPGRNKFG